MANYPQNPTEDFVYILKHQPYKEHQHMAQVWSLQHGKSHVFLSKKHPPRYLYRYRVSWSESPKLKITEMSIDHIHPLTGPSMLASYYVLEWMLTFSPNNMEHASLFNLFAHTLHALEGTCSSEEIEKTLRIYERQSLAHLGYGLNASHLHGISEPFISYHPQHGYLGHDRQDEKSMVLRIEKTQLYDILTDQYAQPGSLKLAKIWFQSIVRSLLPFHEWKCRVLYQSQTPRD